MTVSELFRWRVFGRTQATVDHARRERATAIVVRARDAEWFTKRLEKAGATVVCTLGCDWPKETK